MRSGGLLLGSVLTLTLATGGGAMGDEACLAEVRAFRAEIANDSRLLAKARGELERAADLCRAGRAEEARLLLEAIRAQAGLTMGQGQ